jgi:serine/threonine-protein kinase
LNLAPTLGTVPRVLLRDSDPEAAPEALVRPASPEMPDPDGSPPRLRLLGEIARGGMGAVLKGRDEDLGRDVAVKVLLDSHRDQPELLRRFIEEAQIGGQLQHPGIVPIYELGTFTDRRPYFSMKLVKGRTLAEHLARREAGPPYEDTPRLVAIFTQACQTVAYAHSRGVVHRDLKPSNVMVGPFGEVLVMDWGLAKVLPHGGAIEDGTAGRLSQAETLIATARSGSAVDLSMAGSVMGTPSYMAPEQARGEVGAIDQHADVFALGSILCEILSGRPAYTGHTSGDIVRKASAADLSEALARLDACGAARELVALTRVCLAIAPEDRPHDASVVADRLAAHLAGIQEKLRASERARAIAGARAFEQRKRARLKAALCAVVVAVLGGGGWLLHQRSLRREAAARVVDEALGKADVFRAQAEADPSTALLRLAEAQGEIKRAEDLIRDGQLGGELDRRVAGAKDALAHLRESTEERARREATQNTFRKRFEAIRLGTAEAFGKDWADASIAYAKTFAEAGIDLDAKDAAARLRGSDLREEFIAALDDWCRKFSSWNRGFQPEDPRRVRNLALLEAIDDNTWRRRFRAAVGRGDKAALERLAAGDDALTQPPAVLAWLGVALHDAGLIDATESLLRRAQTVYPGDFWVNYELGRLVYLPARASGDRQRIEAAKACMMAASACRPETTVPRFWLAMAYCSSGDPDEAVRILRRIEPLEPHPYWIAVNLAGILFAQGDYEEGIAASRRAIRATNGHPWGHMGLATGLLRLGRAQEALPEIREAIAQSFNCVEAHARLGEVLHALGKLDEAVAAFRTAVEQYPADVGSRLCLAELLCVQGRHEAALDVLREAFARAKQRSNWDLPAEEWLARCERATALRGRLPVVLRGEDAPRDGNEALTFAQLATDRGHDAAAVRFWEQAFTARPELHEHLYQHCRYDLLVHDRFRAACAAARAGCGEGHDTPPPDEAEKARLRTLAREWLEAELASEARLLLVEPWARATPAREKALHWQTTPELACVRGEQALARLPDSERDGWQAFWARVAEVQRPYASILPAQ